jgi:uncharacterized membrane protein YkoI
MKILSLLALSLVLCFSGFAATPNATAKITKNEAEHIALRKHRGSHVTAAQLETIEGKLVWAVDISGRKGQHVKHVTIDAMSGHVISEKKG